MAFHHHHNNHQCTNPSCHCQPPPCFSHHPPPPSLQTPSYDPFLISTIVSQILHSQNPPTFIKNSHKPTSINQNQSYLLQQNDLLVSSLLHRIDNLETSLNKLSSQSSFFHPPHYLKDVAARVIQTHFRKFLVHRSRTLRELKELANIKSNVTFLKSSFSLHGFVDFDCISRKAMDLLLVLDSFQGEDKMIRDSKKSITREIVEFLELIDEVCLKKHHVMTRKIKMMRLVRNDKSRNGHDIRGNSENAGGSKWRNVDNEEKKLIANLMKRVERIGKMSRALEEGEVEDDDSEGFEHPGDDDSSNYTRIKSKYSPNKGVTINRSVTNGEGSKGQNVDNEGNRMMANLRERVEKIGKMSRALEEEEVVDDDSEGFEHLGDDDGGNFNRIRSKYGSNNGVTSNKSVPHVGGSKSQNVDNEGNRIMANLRERVEKIGKMSRALEEEGVIDDDSEGFEHLGEEDDDTLNQIRSKYGLNNGVIMNKSMPPSNGKKRVCFVEDGSMTRVYNVDGDKIATRDVEEIEDSTTGGQDEEEAQSDGEPSTESSEDVSSSSRCYEVHGVQNHDKEFTFPAPRAEFSTRKPGVKIAE